jgi:hypothetical protein
MFCATGLAFGGTEGVPSCFHIFRSRTCFRRYRGCPVPFSCFTDQSRFRRFKGRRVAFSCFRRTGLVFGGTGGVGLRFLVLRSPTRFCRYRGRRVPFSCFALPGSFSAVPGASGPVFLFCAPRLIIGGTYGVVSRFHVLRARTHFRRYRGRLLPLSCFALPNSF